MTTQYAIDWPGKYLPGTDDDSFTNETIGGRSLTAPWVRHYPFAPRDARVVELPGVLHAWPVEDLPGGRVRVLPRVSQLGRPAAAPAPERPAPRLDGHGAWPVGPVRTASASASGEAVR
ncbi:hypothetical protein [Streptomyces longisporoflavus]|uniref:hypothetical protein n=1 Tax=Streptomyces longisporoflavus TaxID=28044 RepID=UPI00167E1FB6|nr:hypothetical protein [Streptomyces longisporoflavus]